MGAASLGDVKNFRGMAAITLEQYAGCLLDALGRQGRERLHSCPLPQDRQSLMDGLPDASQALFTELFSCKAKDITARANSAPAQTADSPLAELPPSQRSAFLEATVMRIVCELTGSKTAGMDDALMEAGARRQSLP